MPFLTELSPSGANLVTSRYFGGSNADQASGVAVDRSNYVWVTA